MGQGNSIVCRISYPDLRMALDEPELVFADLPRLAQDLGRNRDLPQVVDGRRHPDGVDVLGGEPISVAMARARSDTRCWWPAV